MDLNARACVLWVDLRLGDAYSDVRERFEEYLVLREGVGAPDQRQVSSTRPDAVVFDFDFPDRCALNVLRETKTNFSSTPIVMLTEQHSEALAVWALRARVWDYLVKPIKTLDIERLARELSTLRETRRRDRLERRIVDREDSLPAEVKIRPTGGGAGALRLAVNYVDANLGSPLTAARAAELAGMNSFQFSRHFKKHYGTTFHEFVWKRRMQEAARLLHNPHMPIADIACIVGFDDPSYFTRVFKRVMGCSPVAYLRTHCGEPECNGLACLPIEMGRAELAHVHLC